MKLRNADVFKYWGRDSPEVLAKTYDSDFAYSKLEGIVKDPTQREDVRDEFVKNYDFIKDVFLTLSINSGGFPFINSQEFTRFCRKMNIMDNVINQSRLDFIISNVKAKPKGLDKP